MDLYAKIYRIKSVLVEQDKTSKWLALQVGQSACTEQQDTEPDLQMLEEIAMVLGIYKRDLLTPTMQSKI